MNSMTARRKRNQRGSAFVELAIIAPIMVTMLFGVMDYSRVFYYANIANAAARAGTQVAMLGAHNQTTAIMESAAVADAANVPASQNFTATASQFCECAGTTGSVACNPGSCAGEMYTYVQVNTSLQFQTFFQYPLLPAQLNVQGQSVMRVQ
jgi:Flp pilus assembly protein TadG